MSERARYADDLARIARGAGTARVAFQRFTPGEVAARHKSGDDPVTEADTTVDTLLRELLPRDGDGWLSEETRDDPARLERRRVWVVDPLDGTREFVAGIPEWCVSIGLVMDGEPVAGGICNPVDRRDDRRRPRPGGHPERPPAAGERPLRRSPGRRWSPAAAR